ncbi:MAG: hypothetical protein MZV64_16620 [Ignavibacteriales bacterium]|nr:hypothetical protein [Ignavibacteriales bacterium]
MGPTWSISGNETVWRLDSHWHSPRVTRSTRDRFRAEVVDDRPEGIVVFAYRLDHLLPRHARSWTHGPTSSCRRGRWSIPAFEPPDRHLPPLRRA